MLTSRLLVLGLMVVWVSCLTCSVAVAQEGDELGTGGEETTAAPADAPQPPATQPAGQPAGTKPKPFWKGQGMFLVMIGGMFLLILWMGRSKRKQAAKRKEMLAALKKGDKITTIGGIVGSIIEVREDEITIKVDEGIRMRFARWAIRGVGDQAKVEGPDRK